MRTYKSLPKKYHQMFNNIGELKMEHSAWSYPIRKDGYVYYIYLTCVQGNKDRVYRFTEDEHGELMKLYRCDDVYGLDKTWMYASAEPYIITEPLQ